MLLFVFGLGLDFKQVEFHMGYIFVVFVVFIADPRTVFSVDTPAYIIGVHQIDADDKLFGQEIDPSLLS